jgi:toxin FitB
VAGLTVLDANIIVGYLDADDAHHADARDIVAGADELAASVLTIGEACVDAVRTGRLQELLAALAAIELRTAELSAEAAPTLAELRAQTTLKMPDVCVLYAAMALGADAIGTRDRQLRRVARERGYQTP